MAQLIDSEYGGTALIADPIHRYIQFTVPERKGEITEKSLIDSPWVQRLRYIYQLQSARWVYPSAEHSRFQHSLGAMHLAGEFAKHLYPKVYQFMDEEIRIFKDATKLGFISNCRPLDKIDYTKYLGWKLRDMREDIGLESDLIQAYFRIEQRRYPKSKASQRLLA